jgi:hypothetical protein
MELPGLIISKGEAAFAVAFISEYCNEKGTATKKAFKVAGFSK